MWCVLIHLNWRANNNWIIFFIYIGFGHNAVTVDRITNNSLFFSLRQLIRLISAQMFFVVNAPKTLFNDRPHIRGKNNNRNLLWSFTIDGNSKDFHFYDSFKQQLIAESWFFVEINETCDTNLLVASIFPFSFYQLPSIFWWLCFYYIHKSSLLSTNANDVIGSNCTLYWDRKRERENVDDIINSFENAFSFICVTNRNDTFDSLRNHDLCAVTLFSHRSKIKHIQHWQSMEN